MLDSDLLNTDLIWIEQLKFNDQGLIPAIAQDFRDNTVLMVAWMNRLSLTETLRSQQAHYWSRSRQALWHKGATSGHYQIVKEIYYDCDGDVILLKIEQVGDIACHTGARSCFLHLAFRAEEKNSAPQNVE